MLVLIYGNFFNFIVVDISALFNFEAEVPPCSPPAHGDVSSSSQKTWRPPVHQSRPIHIQQT